MRARQAARQTTTTPATTASLAALLEHRRVGATGRCGRRPLADRAAPVPRRGETLTVFVDAWAVDLEGPDELVRRVLDR